MCLMQPRLVWNFEVHGGVLLLGLLPMACLTCFLLEPTSTIQGRDGTTHNGLGPQSLIKKMTYSWVLYRHFLVESPFFQITTAVSS